jgi:hypothetical protein
MWSRRSSWQASLTRRSREVPRKAKDTEYVELARELRALQAEAIGRRKRALTEEERMRLQSEIIKHENKLKDLRTTDFFGAGGCQAVEGLLHELRAKAAPPEATPKSLSVQSPPHGRTWVTRAGVHVDRIASAWLIRRFIDPEATFKLVPPKALDHQGGLRRRSHSSHLGLWRRSSRFTSGGSGEACAARR